MAKDQATLVTAGRRRWSYVRGPIATLQATLMDIGWNPIKATEWDRPLPEGQLQAWLIPSATDTEYSNDWERIAILGDVVSDMRSLYWQQASKHEDGADLHQGAD
eukprot:1738063-Pyramimonas_sp.AAC.1